ncbi:MAG TPA: glycosyltransferase [Gemmatimonadaceae bacterium]|nr:glycosyltransferase [Gemmatimonadaceae bacterium]
MARSTTLPRVSIVIPARNAGRFLRPAVLSALADGLDGIEAVVVDDGSTDGSLVEIADLPVTVVSGPPRGEAAARNAGVRAAAARFVTFLDADDLMVPGSLAPRTALLEREPEVLAVGGLPSRLIGEDGALLADVFERMAASLSFPLNLDMGFYRSGRFFPVQSALYVYRREVFDAVGPFDEALPGAVDADFQFRLLARSATPLLRVPVFDRRLHGTNLSFGDARTGALAFRPQMLDAIRLINRRHGLDAVEVVPWECEYLG